MGQSRLRSIRSRAALLSAAGLIGILAFAGCSRDRSAPTAPDAASSASSGAGALSIRRPQDVALVMGIQDRHTPELMRIPGVIGTGTGATADGRPEVVVFTDRAGVAGIPAAEEGVIVEARTVGKVVAYVSPFSRRGGAGGPLEMGTSTGNDLECSAGTLGCVATKGSTRYFLSNNHVFARENAASSGERIDAPGRYDGHPKCAQTAQCATLANYVKVSFTSNNTVDCALAQPVAGLSYTAGEAGGYAPTSTVAGAYIGQPVKKTGRTSGLTTGTVQAINVTIQVQYSSGVATFVNQIETPGNFIRSGDSGSLMVEQSTNNPVGLCFAGGGGGSFENPIGPVLQALGGATIVGQ
ncbi:MAG TPA: hypothetical protein VFK69_12460 [Candidatus Eisenbacteria bacterium]|nr:hypothetical protein [Candidatus Eisenbacteria bacterium]